MDSCDSKRSSGRHRTRSSTMKRDIYTGCCRRKMAALGPGISGVARVEQSSGDHPSWAERLTERPTLVRPFGAV